MAAARTPRVAAVTGPESCAQGERRARWLAVVLAAALPCGVAAAREPVVVVDARVVWSDPVLADGELVYALAVEQVVLGDVPGSTIAARASTEEPKAARLAAVTPANTLMRLKLRLGEDGLYELLGAFPAPVERAGPDDAVPPPGGLVIADRAVRNRGARSVDTGVPRRARSALEDLSFEQDIVELVNQQRATFGGVERPPLERVTLLDNSAEGHSSRMETQNFFSHCDLGNGSTHDTRMMAAGYNWNPGAASENILAGPNTPADAMTAWMASDGHRNNILDTGVREIGTGFVVNAAEAANVTVNADTDCDGDVFNQGPFREYWTQNFGRRNGVYPLVIDREASSTNDQTVELYVYNGSPANGETVMTQMQFSNDDVNYSGWEPYDDEKIWQLSAGGGQKTVWVQLDSADAGSTADVESSDGIWFNSSCSTTTLENQDLDGSPSTYQDCNIVAGPNVDVTGNTTFLADTVRLRSGFAVQNGADFDIRPQP